ncbi:MAG: AAA-like domain-containing protein [Elainellaceae cyanobacterium]
MQDIYEEQPIPFEVALKVADAAVFSKSARHLKNIEVSVLRGAWNSQKYDEIADENGYAPEYIKHDVGPKLWQLLSSSFGEKVSKTNLVAVLVQQAESRSGSSSSPASPHKPPYSQSSGASQTSIPSTIEPLVGLVPIDSKFYIKRHPHEQRCYDEIVRPGSLIRIKAPSQTGKTSLMVRILAHAKQHHADFNADEVFVVPLSLQRADKAIFSDLERFLKWFCTTLSYKLRLPHRIEEYWTDTFGSKGNCTAYFEDFLLPEIQSPLVIALDQVDEVFRHPEIADDFFSLLRSWYEEAAYGDSGNPLWQYLRLIIVHSTEVYIPLDINQSPFNVGLAIELTEFIPDQVLELAQCYRLTLSSADISALMHLLGGHPYLTQQAFYHLAQDDLTIGQLLETSATESGIYNNHLHRHLQNLQQHPSLAIAFAEIATASAPVELEQILAFQLRSMGLVKFHGNQVIPSCDLYRHYFTNRLTSTA